MNKDSKEEDYKEFIPILLDLVDNNEKSDDFIVFIGCFAFSVQENETIKPLLDKLREKYKDDEELSSNFVRGFHAFNNYCDQPPASNSSFYDQSKQILQTLMNTPGRPSPESIKESIEQRTDSARKHLIAIIDSSSRHWRSLWVSLAHERSPFFEQKKLALFVHYKRFSMYDRMLCPILLKRNARFTAHIEASLRRDATSINESPKQYEEDTFDDSLSTNNTSISENDENQFFTLPPPKTFMITQKTKLPDRYSWKQNAELIEIDKVQQGVFLIANNNYYFIREESSPIIIPMKKVKKIVLQYILQRQTAVELFVSSKRSYLINFPDVETNKFIPFLKSSIPLSGNIFYQPLQPQQEVQEYTRKWLNYEISTFNYLMQLNELSGRSMNNIQNYPVFPWIIQDYSSDELNLEDPKTFRDLSKPIGALGEERLKKLKKLKENSIEEKPFLYRNMYSCAFTVLHYLIRLEPFTTVHIQHQDNKFDVPTRLFQSIPESYQNVIDSNTNFRELTPEFYYTSEFLHNTDSFDLGYLPNGTQIGDVILPKWAKSAEQFIFLHKKALESDYISEHISDWIDLIWGYKQTGEEAENADNTYDPRLYPDVWQKYTKPEDKDTIEAILHHIGSIPHKLFDAPHPRRQIRPKQIVSIEERESLTTLLKVSDNSILAVRVVGDSTERQHMYILLANGNIALYKNGSISIVSKEKFDHIERVSIGKSDSPVNFVFAQTPSSEVVVVRSNGSIAKYKSKQHIEAIISYCISAHRFITGGNDSILVDWTLNEKGDASEVKSIMVHANAISCCAASNSYGVVVSCSTDGLLIVSFLTDFSFIRSINLNLQPEYVPQSVIVTEGLGLIVVNSSHSQKAIDGASFAVYTLNGRLVSTLELVHRVYNWCIATQNSTDIDYALIVEDRRNVMLYDVFSLKALGVVFTSPERISHIGYYRTTDTLTIGDQKGNLYILPLFRALPFSL